jgi:3-oxoadipate enol-lactonase
MNTLNCREAGPAGRPAIVFLHGSGTTSAMWQDSLSRFGGEYHCLAPDLPGHGENRVLPWKSLSDAADRVATLIESRADHGRAHLVGLSLGGEVAYILLAYHSSRIERAVIDGAAIVPSRVAPLLKAGVSLISPFLHRRTVIRSLGRAVGVPPENLPSFSAGIRSVDPRTFRRAFADAQDPGVLDDVLACPVPTLLISGERELGDIHAANAALASLMPHAQARIVPGAGHGWLAALPDLRARTVGAWIESGALPAELHPETDGWTATRPGRRILKAADRVATRASNR